MKRKPRTEWTYQKKSCLYCGAVFQPLHNQHHHCSPLCKLLQFIAIGPKEVCWPWRKSVDTIGYGSAWIDGRRWPAHRLLWVLLHGPLPSNTHVLHTCDNRRCCNPYHLFLGTPKDNYDDMVQKGRGCLLGKSGEANNAAKLTVSDVVSIKKALLNGATQVDLAKQFNITKENVGRIHRGEIWKSIGPQMTFTPPPRTNLSVDDVKQIKTLLKEGHTAKHIAPLFNVGESGIYKIKQEKSWANV